MTRIIIKIIGKNQWVFTWKTELAINNPANEIMVLSVASLANGFSIECLPLRLNNFETKILNGKTSTPPKKNMIMLICLLSVIVDIPAER